MKKLLSTLLVACMVFCLNIPAQASDEITVTLDGKKIHFDVQPQIIDDFTMVPMRAIFENLGYTVEWDGVTRTVNAQNADGNTIEMTVGNSWMYVGNNTDGFKRVVLEIAPQIVNERTLVPVRAIAEAHGCKVDWDGVTRTVIILNENSVAYYDGTDIPDIKSIVPDVKIISINDAESMYFYELDLDILSEYISILETQYGFTCLEDSPTAFTMCPKGIIGYSLSIDIVEARGCFVLTPWEYTPSDSDETITEEEADAIIDILEQL